MAQSVAQPPQIAFLLGKPVRRSSVFPDVFELLRELPASVAVYLPEGDHAIPTWVFDSTLVVQRGLGLPELTAARQLEDAGIRCCNRISPTMTLHDRDLTLQVLADAGLPVPTTMRAGRWSDVLARADGQPVVVKRADGTVGRGEGVIIAPTGALPRLAPFDGPYIVQEYVLSDGLDHKVYVAGKQAKGLIKRWTPLQTTDKPGVPFTVDQELVNLVRGVGRALGLDIYGVDFLYAASGPMIVDVNPFPGFRNVPQAPRLIAQHLAGLTTGHTET